VDIGVIVPIRRKKRSNGLSQIFFRARMLDRHDLGIASLRVNAGMVDVPQMDPSTASLMEATLLALLFGSGMGG
jgi:hypothetical protein